MSSSEWLEQLKANNKRAQNVLAALAVFVGILTISVFSTNVEATEHLYRAQAVREKTRALDHHLRRFYEEAFRKPQKANDTDSATQAITAWVDASRITSAQWRQLNESLSSNPVWKKWAADSAAMFSSLDEHRTDVELVATHRKNGAPIDATLLTALLRIAVFSRELKQNSELNRQMIDVNQLAERIGLEQARSAPADLKRRFFGIKPYLLVPFNGVEQILTGSSIETDAILELLDKDPAMNSANAVGGYARIRKISEEEQDFVDRAPQSAIVIPILGTQVKLSSIALVAFLGNLFAILYLTILVERFRICALHTTNLAKDEADDIRATISDFPLVSGYSRGAQISQSILLTGPFLLAAVYQVASPFFGYQRQIRTDIPLLATLGVIGVVALFSIAFVLRNSVQRVALECKVPQCFAATCTGTTGYCPPGIPSCRETGTPTKSEQQEAESSVS